MAGCLEERAGTILYEEVIATEASSGTGGDLLAKGRQIYQTYCQGCHAVSGKGTGMTPNQPDFTKSSYWDSRKSEDLINSIANGVKDTPMPAWKEKLTPEDIREALGYIKAFAGK